MISQTAEYALRAMVCLAYRPDDLIATPILADQTKVPANYLAKVLQILAGADLISGRRGVGGGYKLAKPASDIKLLDVLTAIDSVKRIKTCPLGIENHGPHLCPLHERVDEAAKFMIEMFGAVSLSQLVKEDPETMPLCESNPITPLRVDAR